MHFQNMLVAAGLYPRFAGEGDGSGEGSGGSSASEGDSGSGGGDDKKSGNDTDPSKLVSREILTSALSAQRGASEAAIRKATAPLQEKLEALSTTIEEKISQLLEKKTKPKEKGGDSELAVLKQQLAESQQQIETLRAEGEKSKAEAAELAFKTTVQGALAKAGCVKPEAAFLVVRQHLDRNPETGEITHVFNDPAIGEIPYDLNKFVEEVAKETIIPELFRANGGSGGSDAAGDKGGKKTFKFTMDQIKDPEFYAANRDKIEEAMAAGQVKGMPPR